MQRNRFKSNPRQFVWHSVLLEIGGLKKSNDEIAVLRLKK